VEYQERAYMQCQNDGDAVPIAWFTTQMDGLKRSLPHHLGLGIQPALHGLQHFFMFPTPDHE
jgi:hypothetical protein